jgi:hypothetical protein
MTRSAGIALLLAALVLSLGATGALAAALGVTSRALTVFTKTVSAATCTLTAAPNPSTAETDTFVQENSASSNFGTATTLDVRSNPGSRRFSFLRFDLAGCSIPAGANVTSATLKVVLTTAPGSSRQYQVYRVGSSWTETAVTWTTRPGVLSASSTSTTLAANLSNSATSMTVADGSAFPAAPFLVTIESETIRVGAKSGNTFSSLTRGYLGSSSAAHGSGTTVGLLTPTATVTTGTTSGAQLSANVLYDVQAFVTGTATNYGWRINDVDELTNALGQLGSRENGTAANRPTLAVTYVS